MIRGGTLYDGSGSPGVVGDLAVKGGRIVAMGHVSGHGTREIDAHGLAVAPGFINMLSWAGTALIADGRSQSDIRQGVTLEVMGEGNSGGPLNPEMAERIAERQGDIKYPVSWTSFGGYLDMLSGARHLDQCRQLRRRDDGARARTWRGRCRSDAGAARAHAGACPQGDG